MAMDSRHQASEAIKDLMINEKRSRLPLILGVVTFMVLLAGVGYWFYLPPNQRPDLEALKDRAIVLTKSLLNTPIGSAPAATPANPSPDTKKSPPAASTDNVGLLSN
jgi:hypothetical protein